MQLIQRFVEALGKSPVALRRVLGFLSSFWLQWLPTKSKRITGENLRLAFPYMQSSKRRKLLRASLRDLAEKFFDLLATWIQSEQVVRKWVKTSDGLSDFMLACENGPTLILLPHLGNWELFGIWLSGYRSYTAMFRPLRLNVLSVIVRGARERGGNSLVVASHIGVKALLKGLRQGETVIILPDQTPSKGKGEFVPFFGIETLTATLPYRLAQASGARIFLGYAVRSGSHYTAGLKELDLQTVQDQRQWLQQMNLEIEGLVRAYPEQYQWEYSRFRRAPDDTLRYD